MLQREKIRKQRVKNKTQRNFLFEDIERAGLKEFALFLRPDFSLEKYFLDKGYKYIAGVDEAGRGALAGPLSIGMTIYSPDFIKNPLPEITDSETLNSPVKCSKIYSH